jgi:hypothetical protein
VQGGLGTSTPQLKAWPVAYARQLGISGLRRNDQYLDLVYSSSPDYYYSKFGKYDVFVCPSDKILVHDLWSPIDAYGIISYAANEDIFGNTEPLGANVNYAGEGQPWKDMPVVESPGSAWPPRTKRLEGRFDGIIRPSEVALFCDGGNEDNVTNPTQNPMLLLTKSESGHVLNGPFLENYERTWGRLPHSRHSVDGGLNVAMADGSGRHVRAVEWTNILGTSYVKRYAPRTRVSPYQVGTLGAVQP